MMGARGQLLSRRGIHQCINSSGIRRGGGTKNNNNNVGGAAVVTSRVDYYHVWSSSIRKEDDEEEKRLPSGVVTVPSSSSSSLGVVVGPYYNNTTTTTSMTTTGRSSRRGFHTTPAPNRGASVALIFGSVALTAKAGQYAVEAFQDWKTSQPPPEEFQEPSAEDDHPSKATTTNATNEGAPSTKQASSNSSRTSGSSRSSTGSQTASGGEKRENFFAQFFNLSVGSKYYEGGFEDTMTKREAALILGVRESSTPKRIKLAHRKLLILNHPDTGGSTYLSGKLNEAKEMLLKNK